MKRSRISIILLAMIAVITLLGGCGKAEKWAYTHEPEKEVFILYDNGKAVFKDKEYKYTKDDASYTLTDEQGNALSLRYVLDGDRMLLYEPAVYARDETEPGSGITGKWLHENGRNMFRFTKDGQFDEDGYFYGHYNVKENEGTIKLMYADPLQDCILYYSLNGDELTIEYPWPMVQVGVETSEKGQTTIPANTDK